MASVDNPAPPEFQLVLAALGNALAGRRPTEELVRLLAPAYRDTVPAHRAEIAFRPRSKVQRKVMIDVSITGPRLNARWVVKLGDVCDVINVLCPDYKIRLS